MKKVVIVGGGIAGLSTAWFLSEAAKARGIQIGITLVERENRLGGLIQTIHRDGCLMEAGPDAFLSEKPAAADLCRSIGLETELIPTNPEFRRSFFVWGKKLHPVPEGFYLLAPTSWRALWWTPLLTWRGKLRAAMEWVIPADWSGTDCSVADFVRRRFGAELLERIAQPMVGGIYTADLEKLSVQAALPKFYAMEQQAGSVCRALFRKAKTEQADKASGPRYSLFLSLRGGMEQLIERLSGVLQCVESLLGSGIERLEFSAAGWKATLADQRTINADAVCLAIPANAAAVLVRPFSADLAGLLAGIPYESVVTMNLVYRKEDVPAKLNGLGFVVPVAEGNDLVGCSFSSMKFEGRAPQEQYLLRAFIGGAFDPKAAERGDADLSRSVKRWLQKLLGITAEPQQITIHRLRGSMPQYTVGHRERVEKIKREQAKIPGFFLTGNSYDGVGIPDTIEHARKTAQQIMEYLEKAA